MKFLSTILMLLFFQNQSLVIASSEDSAKAFSASIVLTGLYQSGNTVKFITQGRGEVKYSGRILETIVSFTGSYGESKKVKDDNVYLGTFNSDLFYKDMFSPFILQYAEYNFSKGIDFRSQTGGGVKYTFIMNPDHKTSFSLALIYDYLNLVDAPENADRNESRLSLRFKTKQVLFDNAASLNVMVMYQPLIFDPANYNLFADANLDIPLNKIFKLNANYLYGFSDVVSVKRKRADTKLTFGFGAYF